MVKIKVQNIEPSKEEIVKEEIEEEAIPEMETKPLKQQKMISSTVILPESVNNNSCCKLVDLIKEHYDCTAATSAVTATKGCVWINDTFSIRQADDPFGRNFTYTRRDLTNNDISPLDTMPS